MATLELADFHTIIDVAKVYNNKELLDIAENLHRKNGIFRTASWEEANQLTSHVYSKESSLPAGVWRSVNEGIAPETPLMEQGVEPLSRLESRSEIDEYLLDDIVPDRDRYRYEYDMRHVEGLGQTVTDQLFYGNPSGDPNKPRGLSVRYNDLSLNNVVDAGQSTSAQSASVWVIQWGPGKAQMLYGRAGMNGEGEAMIKREDMGKHFVVTNTTTGAGLYKYMTRFYMLMGVVVYDDRAVQRYANIGTDGSDELDINQLIQLIDQVPDLEKQNTYIYANRQTKEQIRRGTSTMPNVFFSGPNEYGMMEDRFYGVPIVLTEALKNTEAVVS